MYKKYTHTKFIYVSYIKFVYTYTKFVCVYTKFTYTYTKFVYKLFIGIRKC
jgi:hypothetical protein